MLGDTTIVFWRRLFDLVALDLDLGEGCLEAGGSERGPLLPTAFECFAEALMDCISVAIEFSVLATDSSPSGVFVALNDSLGFSLQLT